MKNEASHIIFGFFVVIASFANNMLSKTPPKSQQPAAAKVNNNKIPHTSSPAQQVDEIDKDQQVVTESMETMIQALGTFSQNPNNPVVAGVCALQALGAFIKMLIQIFDEFAPTRTLHTQQEIEQWFIRLPKEKQLQIMQLMITYAHIQKNKL